MSAHAPELYQFLAEMHFSILSLTNSQVKLFSNHISSFLHQPPRLPRKNLRACVLRGEPVLLRTEKMLKYGNTIHRRIAKDDFEWASKQYEARDYLCVCFFLDVDGHRWKAIYLKQQLNDADANLVGQKEK